MIEVIVICIARILLMIAIFLYETNRLTYGMISFIGPFGYLSAKI